MSSLIKGASGLLTAAGAAAAIATAVGAGVAESGSGIILAGFCMGIADVCDTNIKNRAYKVAAVTFDAIITAGGIMACVGFYSGFNPVLIGAGAGVALLGLALRIALTVCFPSHSGNNYSAMASA